MDSCMVDVRIMYDVYVTWREKSWVDVTQVDVWGEMPAHIRCMLEAQLMSDFIPTDEEWHDMYESCTRSIGFEVEVDYIVQVDGSLKAKNATCQTVEIGGKEIPGFLKGWLEKKAMKMVEKGMINGTKC